MLSLGKLDGSREKFDTSLFYKRVPFIIVSNESKTFTTIICIEIYFKNLSESK